MSARFGSHLARSDVLATAVAEAASAVRATLGAEPDVLFPFLRATDPNDYRRLPDLLAEHFPGVPLFGCSGSGVIGDGHEEEDVGALGLTGACLPETTLRLVHLDPDEILHEGAISADRLAAVLGVGVDESPDALVLLDPFSLDPDALIRALETALPRSVKLGGLASAGPVPRSSMLYGKLAHRRGALVLLIDGAIRIRALVAQGCRPIGHPHLVTKVDDHAVRELDNKPALEALQALFRELSAEDRVTFRHSLFVGIEMHTDSVEVRSDRLLVRNLLGVAPESGSIGVAGEVNRLDVLHFVLRDSQRATEELTALLERTKTAGAHPIGALLVSCLGRGRHLFGAPDHDSDLLRAAFGPIPIGGFFANGEIAPVGGKTFLHAYTSVFALFEPR